MIMSETNLLSFLGVIKSLPDKILCSKDCKDLVNVNWLDRKKKFCSSDRDQNSKNEGNIIHW